MAIGEMELLLSYMLLTSLTVAAISFVLLLFLVWREVGRFIVSNTVIEELVEENEQLHQMLRSSQA